jgi:MOSC domain-containing protein YiiM
MKAKVVSINISEKKGMRKKPVEEAEIRTNYGIEGDAHSSSEWHRQVSLLAVESIKKMQEMGLDVKAGDFAENITTEGIDLVSLPVGTRLQIGQDIIGEVSQIGKECHTRCAIYYQAGDCVMPKVGIFILVINGGKIKKGDPIVVVQFINAPQPPLKIRGGWGALWNFDLLPMHSLVCRQYFNHERMIHHDYCRMCQTGS